MNILKKSALAAACVGSLLMAGGASAAGTSTLYMTGTVAAICEFASPAYNINFSTLDPSSVIPATSGTNLTYRCTNGTPANFVHMDGGSGTSPRTILMYHDATHSMPVTLTWTTPGTLGSGFGAVAPISFPVTATIAAADLNTAVAGWYGAVVPLLVMP